MKAKKAGQTISIKMKVDDPLWIRLDKLSGHFGRKAFLIRKGVEMIVEQEEAKLRKKGVGEAVDKAINCDR